MTFHWWRATDGEQARVADLMRMLPPNVETAVDIGARDGFISSRLADHGVAVTALDLEKPVLDDVRVTCVKGDATALRFEDDQFDLVFCAEVLEHVPDASLEKACSELVRTAHRYLLIGVPYKQDLRVSRSTCANCGETNPPWGHVNSFDESRLNSLFAGCRAVETSFVGMTSDATNFLSTRLMAAAGNPFGTYVQDEPCIHCGAALTAPPDCSLAGKCLAKAAVWLDRALARRVSPRPKWIHVLFEKPMDQRFVGG